jgi:hypothetical protein
MSSQHARGIDPIFLSDREGTVRLQPVKPSIGLYLLRRLPDAVRAAVTRSSPGQTDLIRRAALFSKWKGCSMHPLNSSTQDLRQLIP